MKKYFLSDDWIWEKTVFMIFMHFESSLNLLMERKEFLVKHNTQASFSVQRLRVFQNQHSAYTKYWKIAKNVAFVFLNPVIFQQFLSF